MKPLTSYTCKLTDEQATALDAALRARNWQPHEVPYARFAFESPKANIVFYESGKLVVQGKGTQEFIEFVLEPEVLKQARLGYETILNPELLLPRIGVDESGKGDFFGPLCIAGVYINESIVKAWRDSGVRDSKKISSDTKIAQLAKVIVETPGCVSKVVVIGNFRYNGLYHEMGSVNRMLAWGHARAIEDLLLRSYQMNPMPRFAICDQFAPTESTILQKLLQEGKKFSIRQYHKAEEDMAVAAASILARNEFVTRLAKLGNKYGTEFPKGAGPAVDEVARTFFQQYGASELSRVAKMHFRTAYRAQGLPEPPKTEWRR